MVSERPPNPRTVRPKNRNSEIQNKDRCSDKAAIYNQILSTLYFAYFGVNFHIGRSKETEEEDVKKFFYNFGPNRLEELLQEECEEGIRNFVKGIRVNRVRDVKTELTSSLLLDLAEKFSIYGVVIEQVNIMNVILPRDLRVCLMETTNYDVFLQKQVKWQENKLLIVTNNENKAILKLKRDNMQMLFKLQHDFDVEEINVLETTI